MSEQTPQIAWPEREETPPDRLMRQWYQAKLGERMGQFASMEANKQILRRGAMKMQDGTLNTATGEPEAEDVNVRVGDEIHQHYHAAPGPTTQPTAIPAAPAPASPAPVEATPTEQPTSAWKTWLARTALAAGGLAAGAGGLAGYNWLTAPEEKPPAVEQQADDAGAYLRYGVSVRNPED